MGSVTIAIGVNVILGNGTTPLGTAIKLDVLDVDTGIDDINVYTFTAFGVVDIASEGAKGELGAVADAGETLLSGRQTES
jgi:hypothetical protein